MRNYKIKFSLFLSFLFLSNCGKGPDEGLSYIPKNTNFILSANIQNLLQKANYTKMLDSNVGIEFLRQVRDIAPQFKDIVKNPGNAGLDLTSPAYAFGSDFHVDDYGQSVANIYYFIDEYQGSGVEDYIKTKAKYDKTGIVTNWRIDSLKNSLTTEKLEKLFYENPNVKKNVFSFLNEWDVQMSVDLDARAPDRYSNKYRNHRYFIDTLTFTSNDNYPLGPGHIINATGRAPYYSNSNASLSTGYSGSFGESAKGGIPNVGIIIPIANKDIVSQTVSTISDLADEFELVKTEKGAYVKNGGEGSTDITFGYNDDIFFFFGHNNSSYDELFKQGLDNWTRHGAEISNNTFKSEFTSQLGLDELGSNDLNVWAKSLGIIFNDIKEIYMNDFGGLLISSFGEKISKYNPNAYSMGLNFENDVMNYNFKIHSNNSLTKVLSKLGKMKIDKKIIGLFPGDPLFGGGFNLPIELANTAFDSIYANLEDNNKVEFDKGLKEIEDNIKMPVQKTFKILDGNFFITINEFDLNSRELLQDISLAIKINDNKLFEKVLENLSPKIESGNNKEAIYMWKSFKDYESIDLSLIDRGLIGFTMGRDKNFIYISSATNIANLKEGNKDSQFYKNLPSDPTQTNLYIFANGSKIINRIPFGKKGEQKKIGDFLKGLNAGISDLSINFEKTKVEINTNIRIANSGGQNILEKTISNFIDLIDDL